MSPSLVLWLQQFQPAVEKELGKWNRVGTSRGCTGRTVGRGFISKHEVQGDLKEGFHCSQGRLGLDESLIDELRI